MSSKPQKLHPNQQGLVSFIVVLFIMFILSLIVLAFARLVNREQTQTLDRQLNIQALYAAESGVNDALDALRRDAVPPVEYTQCSGPGSFIDEAGLDNDLGNGISYSCLLVDPAPMRLDYPDLPVGTSTVVPLRSDTGGNISRIRVYWDDSALAGGSTISGCQANTTAQAFYPAALPANCQMGTLRLELVPFLTASATNITRDTLISSKGIVFLTPRASGGDNSVNLNEMNGDSQGLRMNGDCSGGGSRPRRCMLEITNPGGSGLNMRQGYLRVQSLYRSSNVSVEAFIGSTQVGLAGAQAEVDVTGRVSGVLKRIKVSAPLPSDADEDPVPEFALQTTKTQCKRFNWRPGVIALDGDMVSALSGAGMSAAQINALCDPRV